MEAIRRARRWHGRPDCLALAQPAGQPSTCTSGRPLERQRFRVYAEVSKGPGPKPIFPLRTAIARLQLAIPEIQMEKLRLLAAFRNVHQAVLLAELIEDGWDNHHLEWMNKDLMQPPGTRRKSGESGREGK